MTRIALRGMAANQVGRARISMMARSMSSNTRPDTLVQDRTPQPHHFPLATHGGSIHLGHGEAKRDVRAVAQLGGDRIPTFGVVIRADMRPVSAA
jgi:hypothetical protein